MMEHDDFEDRDRTVKLPPLTINEWLARDLPEPDYLMGSVFSTTTRALMFAPTGIGKTMMTMALGFAMAAGAPFLHWQGRRPSRVLFVDGELSRRLMKRRIIDAVNRFGGKPAGFRTLCFDDYENAQPVNTPEGQQLVERTIARMGGCDFIVLDSVMALTAGSMKEEDSWAETMPWARTLTQRGIGQFWVHHTGHDESRSYGTKIREWGMDLVIQNERVERPDTDVSFKLSFTKARERTPETRDDFQSTEVALVDGQWTYALSEGGGKGKSRGKVTGTAQKFLMALTNVLATGATVRMINGKRASTMDHWLAECVVMGLIDTQAKAHSARSMFSQYRRELIGAGLVACEGDIAWTI